MTIIEFYEREHAIENMVSTLLCRPDKVVFIGDSTKKIKRNIEKYKAVAQKRNISVEFEAIGVSKNNLEGIIDALENVIAENDDCIIDLTAGDDLYLVAVGVVYSNRADEVKLHRFNISNNKMIDCDRDGKTCAIEPMKISVEENISLYGGRVIFDDEKSNGTHKWDFNKNFVDDIHCMWSICKENPTNWNVQIHTLDKLCGKYLEADELSVYANYEHAKEVLGEKGDKLIMRPDLLRRIYRNGLIDNLILDDDGFGFTFKNHQVKRCLTKAGLLLELVFAVTAMEVEEEGEACYNDVMTGVCIDWDGTVQPASKADVENEVDIILMKGIVPVFVSCKNGAVSMDELYKLSVVAERFGGNYVRKVLVASELDKMGPHADYIKARAEIMGIKIVDNVDALDDDGLADAVKKLWRI